MAIPSKKQVALLLWFASRVSSSSASVASCDGKDQKCLPHVDDDTSMLQSSVNLQGCSGGVDAQRNRCTDDSTLLQTGAKRVVAQPVFMSKSMADKFAEATAPAESCNSWQASRECMGSVSRLKEGEVTQSDVDAGFDPEQKCLGVCEAQGKKCCQYRAVNNQCRASDEDGTKTGKSSNSATAVCALEPWSPHPGEAWTEDEQSEVRQSILHMFEENRGQTVFSSVKPTAAKAVRLGFHDCLKYDDGTGGCDGCLDWEAIDFRLSSSARGNGDFRKPKQEWLNPNRGLEGLVAALEEIYVKPLASTGKSLRRNGKTRADLWAFAAIVGIDFGVQTNNDECDNKLGHLKESIAAVCLQDSDPSGCKVNLPRALIPQFGRIDCNESYMGSKREVPPSNDLSGPQLTQYFKEQFGFNGRETVAIMGAHSMGAFHTAISGYWYTYVTQQEDAFNNQYFRNMALKDEWFYEDENCTKQGNSSHQRGPAKWRMKAQAAYNDLAPVQWIQHKLICPNCMWVEAERRGDANPWPSGFTEGAKRRAREACLNGVPEGKACKPGSEEWRFVWGRDEAGTNSDMGMYYDFHVDDKGFPFGCDDLDRAEWVYNGRRGTGNNGYLQARKNYNVDHGCGLQMHAEPQGDQPLHEIVEEFADDKNAFLAVFVPTYEKMLANGNWTLTPALP